MLHQIHEAGLSIKYEFPPYQRQRPKHGLLRLCFGLEISQLSKSDDHLARNTYHGTHLLQAAGKVPNSGDWRRHIKGKPHQAKVARARTAANTSTQAGSAAFILAKMKELPAPVRKRILARETPPSGPNVIYMKCTRDLHCRRDTTKSPKTI